MTYQADIDDVVLVSVPHGTDFRAIVLSAAPLKRKGLECHYVTVARLEANGERGTRFGFAQRDVQDGALFPGNKRLIFVEKYVPAPVVSEDGSQVFLVFERDNDEYPSTVDLLHVHRTREGAVKRIRGIIEGAGGTFVDDEAEWVVGDKEYFISASNLGD